jgi:hypothetical protein
MPTTYTPALAEVAKAADLFDAGCGVGYYPEGEAIVVTVQGQRALIAVDNTAAANQVTLWPTGMTRAIPAHPDETRARAATILLAAILGGR